MGYQVRVEPSGKTFEVVGGDSLLEAALRAGLPFAYGCSNGHCGQCRARLLAGRVETVRHHDFSFGEAGTLAGAILSCAVTAASDLVLEAGEAAGVEQIRPQSLSTRLHEVTAVDEALALVTLRTPRSQRFRFVAGQRARLSAPGLPPLELGIASCPCEEGVLRFDLPRVGDAALATALLEGRLRRFSTIGVDGPEGRFVLDTDDPRPLLLVAVDSGFAAIRSLVEHALALEQCPALFLWRVATRPPGLYLDNLCRTWGDALDDFDYRPHQLPGADAAAVAALADALAATLPEEPLATYVAGPAALAEPLAERLRELRGGRGALYLETAGCPG